METLLQASTTRFVFFRQSPGFTAAAVAAMTPRIRTNPAIF
ncbi:MAG TPA: hypothetical protein VNY05_37310 [Candidatus Acidoferrales bacterium]|nr:hypothetical protein [Candidatus Acidoferrales bacterium]